MAEYIEREAAIKAATENDYEGYATWAIKAIPTADVAPVRHGRWIKADSNPLHGDYYCSECQHGVDIGDGEETPFDRGVYYCPNCGAKMDEDARHAETDR